MRPPPFQPWLVLPAMFVVGLAWWALGQWLRCRGYGPRLARLNLALGGLRRALARQVLLPCARVLTLLFPARPPKS